MNDSAVPVCRGLDERKFFPEDREVDSTGLP